MSSLYKRATPAQARVLRIVEGAVKNATDAHPNLQISPQHRRSIAKRAAGTLTAQWPEVLAASKTLSDSRETTKGTRGRGRGAQTQKPLARGGAQLRSASPLGRFPLRQLISEISRPIRGLKITGQTERAAALIDVLRLIHRLRMGEP